MAIAKNQIEDVYRIIRSYLRSEEMGRLLLELKTTTAYRLNKSFQETIDRLLIQWSENGNDKLNIETSLSKRISEIIFARVGVVDVNVAHHISREIAKGLLGEL